MLIARVMPTMTVSISGSALCGSYLTQSYAWITVKPLGELVILAARHRTN
jgi:hypothetical protein